MSEYKLLLNGDWLVGKYDKLLLDFADDFNSINWIKSRVPRSIHYDLMDAVIINNIFESSQSAKDAEWVCFSSWVYKKTFDVPKDYIGKKRIFISFDCIDTFSDIYINDVYVGSTSDMFLQYRFEITDLPLKQKDNMLIVHIKAHDKMVERKINIAKEKLKISDPSGYLLLKSLVRRNQRNFQKDLLGFDSVVLGIGIVGDVKLEFFDDAFIEDYRIDLVSLSNQEAELKIGVKTNTKNPCKRYSIDVKIFDMKNSLCASKIIDDVNFDNYLCLTFKIENPKLWWPRGYGEQNLYILKITLFENHNIIHIIEKHFGIRKVELVETESDGKKTFYFKINGKKIYIRGANLMPIDYLNSYGTYAQYKNMIDLAINANMNMIRLWGGGINDPDYFFDMCDKYGIMVWKDFYFHSAPYPDYDEEFIKQVTEEAGFTVKKLSKHPFVVVFCGGNEQQEGWDNWGWQDIHERFFGERLISDIFPEVVKRESSGILYIKNSPFGQKLGQSPVDGDTHTWGNYYNSTKDPQFVTETCWNIASYSKPKTLEKYIGIKMDDFNQKGWSNKWKSLTCLNLITKNPYSEYYNLQSLRQYLHTLEIEQLMADYHALYNLRCKSPSCNGILYWSFNKGGPLFNYGCVDYDGVPLAAYYGLKRIFSDIVVHAYRDINDIRIVASNLQFKKWEGYLCIKHISTKENVICDITLPVSVEPERSVRLYELSDYYKNISDRWQEIIYVNLSDLKGNVLTEDFLYFCPLSELEVAFPDVSIGYEKVDNKTLDIYIVSSKFIKLFEIEENEQVILSDNFFAVAPHMKKKVCMISKDGFYKQDKIILKAKALDIDRYFQFEINIK